MAASLSGVGIVSCCSPRTRADECSREGTIMAKTNSHPQEAARTTRAGPLQQPLGRDALSIRRSRVLQRAEEVRILDPALVREYIRQRQSQQCDKYDEV